MENIDLLVYKNIIVVLFHRLVYLVNFLLSI